MVAITCTACGKAAELDERWRGCLRPCPHCGGFVEVPEDSRLVEGPVPVEPRCFCGSEQVGPVIGYFAFYRLGMLLLAHGLSAAYARSWDLLPIEEARSPVLRYPDGTYAPTYRAPPGAGGPM